MDYDMAQEKSVPAREVRAWARENGFDVAQKGIIPNRVWDAYAVAHAPQKKVSANLHKQIRSLRRDNEVLRTKLKEAERVAEHLGAEADKVAVLDRDLDEMRATIRPLQEEIDTLRHERQQDRAVTSAIVTAIIDRFGVHLLPQKGQS